MVLGHYTSVRMIYDSLAVEFDYTSCKQTINSILSDGCDANTVISHTVYVISLASPPSSEHCTTYFCNCICNNTIVSDDRVGRRGRPQSWITKVWNRFVSRHIEIVDFLF